MEISFANENNAVFYERKFKEGIDHWYPNVNTVRISKVFFPKTGKALDYGFGFAQEALHFLRLGLEVEGLDISATAVKRGNKKLSEAGYEGKFNLQAVNLEWDKLPYPDNYFDVIHSNQTIYFLGSLKKIEKLLAEFHRVLKPGGKMSISTIGPQDMICSEGKKTDDENVFLCGELKDDGRVSYVFPTEEALRHAFRAFKIQEVGFFHHKYLGVTDFHWVC